MSCDASQSLVAPSSILEQVKMEASRREEISLDSNEQEGSSPK